MAKKTARQAGENEILKFLHDRFSKKCRMLKKGMGDDAAVILPAHSSEFWFITTDMLVETIDFRREWTPPRQLGRKSISVNLSDLAAMGARPRFFTVSLGLPAGIPRRWIAEFYRGLTEKGDAYGALLIGGDLSGSPDRIVISITAIRESIGRRAIYRSGGRAGDNLYVTGVLGRSAAGLGLLQKGCIRPRMESKKEALRIHRDPDPQCEAGMWLAHCGMIRCMMDLSDGLSVDLPRLCIAGSTGAEIDTNLLPVFNEAAAWGFDPVALALHGGEDFELLFAVAGSKTHIFEKSYPKHLPRVTRIGKMVQGNGDVWSHSGGKKRRRLGKHGFDHFKRD